MRELVFAGQRKRKNPCSFKMIYPCDEVGSREADWALIYTGRTLDREKGRPVTSSLLFLEEGCSQKYIIRKSGLM